MKYQKWQNVYHWAIIKILNQKLYSHQMLICDRMLNDSQKMVLSLWMAPNKTIRWLFIAPDTNIRFHFWVSIVAFPLMIISYNRYTSIALTSITQQWRWFVFLFVVFTQFYLSLVYFENNLCFIFIFGLDWCSILCVRFTNVWFTGKQKTITKNWDVTLIYLHGIGFFVHLGWHRCLWSKVIY